MTRFEFQKSTINKAAQKIITDLVRGGTIILLNGEMAAGKTTLVSAIAKLLGYQGAFSSPTFVIERRYQIDYNEIKQIIHLDFYRLNNVAAESFDWADYSLPDTVTFIEWPQIAQPHIATVAKTVKITVVDDETRRIEY